MSSANKAMMGNGAVDELQAHFNNALAMVSINRQANGISHAGRRAGHKKNQKLAHSDEVFEQEFKRVFERREYTQIQTERFYRDMVSHP